MNCYTNAVVDFIDHLKDKVLDWFEITDCRITNSKTPTEAYKYKMKALNYPPDVVGYLGDFISSKKPLL
ncbi:hypothetical protein ACV6RK_004070 [Cronobacter malonaticus]|uniref:hypothetical protein n=1 Tax=Cronobacter malonaticus TaxID=413503 RepID=UPI000F4DA5F6|nr:hypothetical protein [Cronobacter malonaticus]ELY6204955.1 hypothetical protein [Cronobacter malonaticus]ELY6230983.1 hypothetical protein [Cronobacter malonaticus]MDI6470377.1 hypothetical protein [Cronobacter malonaticus]MDK1177405.1 hypothetical protein [Cronobacter malonaticus]MDK1689595.1 hypothetical protein [Cronobacter malonaticus]